MAALEILICSPANDTVWTDTVTMSNEDSLYPAANIKTNNPQEVAKSTTTGSTFTFTHAGAMTSAPIVGLTIHNHDLPGATVTFGGVSVTIPARSSDGQCTNVFLDRRLSPIAAAGSHTLVVSGAPSGFSIGRVCIATILSPVKLRVESDDIKWSTVWPRTEEPDYYLGALTYIRGIRIRQIEGQTATGVDQAVILAVLQASNGLNQPFAFIFDSTVNDSWFARASALVTWRQVSIDSRMMLLDVLIREVSMGLPP